MKLINDLTTKELLDKYILQLDSNGCWFACSLMARNILQPEYQMDYNVQKDLFYETQTYAAFLQFYLDAGLLPHDLFRYGASSDIVCGYLREMTGTAFSFTHGLSKENIFMLIMANIDLKKPVIMAINDRHYVIVVGYDKDSEVVYYLDPMKGSILISASLSTISQINEIIY